MNGGGPAAVAATDRRPGAAASSPGGVPWPADDPFPTYAALRTAHGDVAWSDDAGAWLVLGYEAARAVLRGDGWSSDPTTATDLRARLEAADLDGETFGRLMLLTDPPHHTRLRGAARPAFAPAAVARLTERVDALAAECVDPLPAGEPVDVIAAVARPLPLAVMAEWLDLGEDGATLLWDESADLVRVLDLDVAPDALARTAASFVTLVAHLLPLAIERRRHPGRDLLSALATAADPALALDEVVVTAMLLAVAGHETTTNLIGNALVALLPPDREPLAAPDALRSPPVIDELLRLAGPVQALARTATTDRRIGDHSPVVRAGDRVLVVVAAANRDPAAFPDPDRFDPTRRGPAPLAFGLGRHHCLGAPLARIEAAAVLPRLLARQPVRPPGPVRWRPTPTIRGPESLELRLTH